MLAFCVANITNLSKTPQTSNTKIHIFTIWKYFPEIFYSLNVLGGDGRICGGDLGRSTVAHFARKVRGANIAAALRGLKFQGARGEGSN